MKFLLVSCLLHLPLIYLPFSGQNNLLISSQDTAVSISVRLQEQKVEKRFNNGLQKKMAAEKNQSGHVSKNLATKENVTGQKNDTTGQELYHPAPHYPRLARERGWQGSVLIQVSTDEQGHIKEQNLLKSSGFDILDQAALDAVKTWKTVSNLHREVVPITFKLTESL